MYSIAAILQFCILCYNTCILKTSKTLNYYISMRANLIGVSTLVMNYEKRGYKNAISLCVLLLKIIKTGRLK
jgi:hypothetical protein